MYRVTVCACHIEIKGYLLTYYRYRVTLLRSQVFPTPTIVIYSRCGVLVTWVHNDVGAAHARLVKTRRRSSVFFAVDNDKTVMLASYLPPKAVYDIEACLRPAGVAQFKRGRKCNQA